MSGMACKLFWCWQDVFSGYFNVLIGTQEAASNWPTPQMSHFHFLKVSNFTSLTAKTLGYCFSYFFLLLMMSFGYLPTIIDHYEVLYFQYYNNKNNYILMLWPPKCRMGHAHFLDQIKRTSFHHQGVKLQWDSSRLGVNTWIYIYTNITLYMTFYFSLNPHQLLTHNFCIIHTLSLLHFSKWRISFPIESNRWCA